MPQMLFADSAPADGQIRNYLRFRLSPNSAVALAARVKRAGPGIRRRTARAFHVREEQPGEETPYERLLGDAMRGDGALFARKRGRGRMGSGGHGAQEHPRALRYQRRTWGPKKAYKLTAAHGGWHNPEREGFLSVFRPPEPQSLECSDVAGRQLRTSPIRGALRLKGIALQSSRISVPRLWVAP